MPQENISISEDRLRRILAEFKLELMRELQHDPWRHAIEKRIGAITADVESLKAASTTHKAVTAMWWKIVGAAAAVATACGAIGGLVFGLFHRTHT